MQTLCGHGVLLQVPPGGTNFQFRDPTEGRHAVYYALAIGVQAYCLGGAGIFTAPDMAGPWTYRGSLFNQATIEPNVSSQAQSYSGVTCTSGQLYRDTSLPVSVACLPCSANAACSVVTAAATALLSSHTGLASFATVLCCVLRCAVLWCVLQVNGQCAASRTDISPNRTTPVGAAYGESVARDVNIALPESATRGVDLFLLSKPGCSQAVLQQPQPHQQISPAHWPGGQSPMLSQ